MDSGVGDPIPLTLLTGWVALSKSLNVSIFRVFISRVGIMLKVALQGFCEQYMS